MDRTSTCNGDGTTAKTPKNNTSRSGKSNWANFNEKRKRDALRRKGSLPSHRHGKQPLQKPLQTKTVRKSTRVIQRAIRLESPLPFSEPETEDANDESNFEDDDFASDRLDDRHNDGLSFDDDSVTYDGLGLLSGCVSPEEFTMS